MEYVHKEQVELIISTLREIFSSVNTTRLFDLHEFYEKLEPKFQEAGYRQEKKIGETISILIIHDAAAGDLIAQSGAIREIRRIYPDAHITLVVSKSVVSLAEFCPHIDELIPNARIFNSGSVMEIFDWNIGMAEKLLTRRYDICFAFTQNRDTPLLSYMSGARIRISHDFHIEFKERIIWFGINDPIMNNLITLSTHLTPLNVHGNHMVDACFSLIERLTMTPITNREIEVWYTKLDVQLAKDFLKDATGSIYGLGIGGSHRRKHYPPEKYAELMKMIVSEEPDATFVIIGGGEIDLQSAEIIKNTVPEIYEKNIIDLTDKINYRQSAAVLSLCDMYIGNDTGTMHMAAAVKIPVLNARCHPQDIPGNADSDYIVWAPYRVPNIIIRPKNALPECTDNKIYDHYGCKNIFEPHCITQIPPEELFDGFKKLKEKVDNGNHKH